MRKRVDLLHLLSRRVSFFQMLDDFGPLLRRIGHIPLLIERLDERRGG
jgi:hypothetical protein